jgi:hypothetical protein
MDRLLSKENAVQRGEVHGVSQVYFLDTFYSLYGATVMTGTLSS